MKLKRAKICFGAKEKVKTLVWTADWHYGAVSCSEKTIDLCIATIKDRKLPFIHGADIVEAIVPTDKRFDVRIEGKPVLKQAFEIAARIKPIAGQCLGLLAGNHEGSVSRIFGDLSESICQMSGIEPLTETAFLTLECPQGNLTVFCSHHSPSANYKAGEPERIDANRRVRIRDGFIRFNAGLKLGAHIHRFICSPPVHLITLGVEKEKVTETMRCVRPGWHVVCPSMMRVYTEHPHYAQSRLCDPANIGWAEIDIDRTGRVLEVRHIGSDGQTLETVQEKVVA